MLWEVSVSKVSSEKACKFLLEVNIIYARERRQSHSRRSYEEMLPRDPSEDEECEKKRYHHIKEGDIWSDEAHLEEERLVEHKLESKGSEIRHEAIGTEENNRRDKGIGKYWFCLFHLLFISGCRNHIERGEDQKSDHHWRCEVERETEELVSDGREFSEEISLRDHTSPYFYKSEKDETEDPIEDSSFCFFLYFFIPCWEDETKESPREGEDRDTKDKDFEKTDNRRDKSIDPKEGGTIPEFEICDISEIPKRSTRDPERISEEDDIDGSWNIEKKKGDEHIGHLATLGFDFIFILWKNNHRCPHDNDIN